jgi:crotonobetainyl-CoA:carnitine CoA-transferase CaiB-like acyl-CoA transferase
VRLGKDAGQLNRSPAPCLGQHNREVLVDVLGVTDGDVDQLETDGVIGSVPGGGGHAW